MSVRMEGYVRESVAAAWWLGGEAKLRLGAEIRDHLESAVEEGLNSGLGRDEAEAAAIRGLGRPRRAAMGFLGVSGWGLSKRVFWTVVLICVVTRTVSDALFMHSPPLRPIDAPAMAPYLVVLIVGAAVMAWYCAKNMTVPIVAICVGALLSVFTCSLASSPFKGTANTQNGLQVVDVPDVNELRRLNDMFDVMLGATKVYKAGGLDAVNAHFGMPAGSPYITLVRGNDRFTTADRNEAMGRWQAHLGSVRRWETNQALNRQEIKEAMRPAWQRVPGLMEVRVRLWEPLVGTFFLVPAVVGWFIGHVATWGSVLSVRRRAGQNLVR